MAVRFASCLSVAAASMLIALPADASGGGGGGAGSDAPAFVDLAPITVPVVDGARADGRLLVTLTIEASDPAAAAGLAAHVPQLREASIAAAGEFARLRVSPGRAVDASKLTDALVGALQAREAGVTRVLVVHVRAERT